MSWAQPQVIPVTWEPWDPVLTRSPSPDQGIRVPDAPLPAPVREIDVKLSILRILTERLEEDRKRALQDAAPIKRLPPEILSRIFETAAQMNQNIPLRVSLVCHRWREVTLSTPSLFSNISIGNVLQNGRLGSSWMYNAQLPYRVQMFLDRSRFADLVLRIDISKREHYADFPVLIQTLGSHLWRCRIFHVYGITEPGLDVVRTMCTQMLGSGARLQELSLSASGQLLPAVTPASPTPLPDHGSFPRLHTLVMEGIHPSSFRVTTPSLRTLRLRTGVRSSGRRRREDTALAPFLELARHVAQLRELEIDMWGVTISPLEFLSSGSHTVVTMPSVEKLSIVHGAHSHNLAPLLDCLSLPNLSHLCLWSGDGGSSNVLPSFISTLAAPITYLSISTYSLTGSAVLPLLQALQSMSQLAALHVCHTVLDTQLVEALSHRIPRRDGQGSGAWLAPQLRELAFKHCDGLVLADVVRLAEKRGAAQDSTAIERLGVWWCIGVDQLEVLRLREVVREVSIRGW
ncbi:hypothetical protein EXIGLDRAFT_829607 [Exidia glandulosa HHB12029]|uniref:F-box domain-containing protein n=1 Tax=Exidia glandulosa HHB12029 TaxID=1314781 RepID=A0A165PE55_EXIGL|nr:hypothetical protein EXIGLDRAFT_829607 [Exidia glandulosa HHB12029]